MIEICKLIEAAYSAENEEDDEEDGDDEDLEPVDYVKKYETETGRDFETGDTIPF